MAGHLAQKECPACGTEIQALDRFCSSCGVELVRKVEETPRVDAATFSPAILKNPYVGWVSKECPACGFEHIQKVSAVVASGAWSSMGRGGDAATHLALDLAPPVEPDHPRSYSVTIVICLLAILCVSAFALMGAAFGPSPDHLSASILPTLVCLLCLGLILALIRTDQVRHERNGMAFRSARARWERAQRVWDRLYYCPRCDTVHDPGTMRFAPRTQVGVLL